MNMNNHDLNFIRSSLHIKNQEDHKLKKQIVKNIPAFCIYSESRDTHF